MGCEETIAKVDAAKAFVDKIFGIFNDLFQPQPLVYSPMELIILMLEKMGVTYEELVLFLVRIARIAAPAMEVGVKAILLTNLKSMVSCSVDPRIPDYMRKMQGVCNDGQIGGDYGIDINVDAIDYLDKLTINPLSDRGRELYFGLDDATNVYKFARAFDFDAFLWFVIHRGEFLNANTVDAEKLEDYFKTFGHGGVSIEPKPCSVKVSTLSTKNRKGNITPSLLECLKLEYNPDDDCTSNVMPGNTFVYAKEHGSPNVISMCIDRKYDEEKNKVIENTLVPVAMDECGVNWYTSGKMGLANLGVRRMNKNGDSKDIKNRDYTREHAICNLQYLGQTDSKLSVDDGLASRRIRFCVLPKPYVHIPNVKEGEHITAFKRLTFDAFGNFDVLGKYTLSDDAIRTEKLDDYRTRELYYTKKGKEVTIEARDVFYSKDGRVENAYLKINGHTGKIEVINVEELRKNLVECFPGLTVYEFNYEFVMSIRLFDPKILVNNLIEALTNARIGINLSLGVGGSTEAAMMIKDIIKNILSDPGNSVDDCFFKFSNKKYDEMLSRTEQAKAGVYKTDKGTMDTSAYQNAMDVMKEYDAETTIEGQDKVLKRAIFEAVKESKESYDTGMTEDDYSMAVNFGIVQNLLENLAFALTSAILTPKVLLLFEVNKQLMGDSWRGFSLHDLLRSMMFIITQVIYEIRDLILQELLKWLTLKLKVVIEVMSSQIIMEQVEDYVELMQDLMRNCPAIWLKFGNQFEESKLDTVDYADIDAGQTDDNDEPKSKCS